LKFEFVQPLVGRANSKHEGQYLGISKESKHRPSDKSFFIRENFHFLFEI